MVLLLLDGEYSGKLVGAKTESHPQNGVPICPTIELMSDMYHANYEYNTTYQIHPYYWS
jgi:hypothetical protein